MFIWGLLEARLQQADLMVLGGLNEGVWPALPAPDPWLAPRIRANLGMPGLEFRIGLAAHDFASALGAPQVLITRARRDSRSPTVASRFWLRLRAMTGGLAARHAARAAGRGARRSGRARRRPSAPAPSPPTAQRPTRISVTAVDRLKADPFAFYAQAMLGLRRSTRSTPTTARRGRAPRSTRCSSNGWREDDCDPATLLPRAEALLGGAAIHPMLRALWQPRLIEAIRWIEEQERDNAPRAGCR